MTMPRGLRWTLLAVDVAMIAYWGLATLAVIGVVALPASAMYDGYGTPLIDAWNWSFAPLDLLFATAGLTSVRLARSGNARWRDWAVISLTLTGCAGLMAVSFWALTGDFDPGWWGANLALMAVAAFWLPRLLVKRA